ncbi:MAG: RNA polymerase sigma factor [Pseudomonas sp.]|jgi:RNA polymerase sigma-70 factor (ECF subfamily)|nr:RNA polymerase sigma factor [Pseudomonas sp.]MDD2224331.1 sigma-70 family RNA polymerase sigma factor [Pseudomonas sp.]MDY0413932.1 sigma-70 family RNA polymerase sigma factor [Pseudomonas sp.]NLO53490.1 sigma-70 family RNA polymerase sigma factor [Gammaproteobacteria bacterium]
MTPHCILTAWHAHEQEVRAFLVTRLDSSDQVDDVLQELFLKLARQNTAFCTVQNPRAWLFRVVRNYLIDRQRTAKTFVEINLDTELPLNSDEPPALVKLEACLLRNLTELCEQDQSVIEHCDLHGQTQQRYAQQHELTLSAVKSRLLRARQRLREKIIINCQVEFNEHGQVCCHVPR